MKTKAKTRRTKKPVKKAKRKGPDRILRVRHTERWWAKVVGRKRKDGSWYVHPCKAFPKGANVPDYEVVVICRV